MFSWFRRNRLPDPRGVPTCKGNPGRGAKGRMRCERDGRTWTEETDAVRAIARVLGRHKHRVKVRDTWLEHRSSGYIIRPQLVDAILLEKGGIRSVTTVEVSHPTLVPGGIFEYQHAAGDDLEDAIDKGFDLWVKTDLIVLLDAIRPKAADCMAWEMEFPAQEGRPVRRRRAILGPVAHFAKNPPPAPANPGPGADPGAAVDEGDAHPFCTCCFLTRSFEAFKELFEDTGFFAIRFFAVRDEQGMAEADCRVNGEDWEVGAEALRKYASTWPEAGYEFRKQYVVLHTLGKGLA
jgi:Family of unknown function (DUF6348)